jgi:hypothetical protein
MLQTFSMRNRYIHAKGNTKILTLTPWSIVFWEADKVSASQGIPRPFMETECSEPCSQGPATVSISWARWVQFTTCFCMIHFNVIHPPMSTTLYLKVVQLNLIHFSSPTCVLHTVPIQFSMVTVIVDIFGEKCKWRACHYTAFLSFSLLDPNILFSTCSQTRSDSEIHRKQQAKVICSFRHLKINLIRVILS